MSFPAGPSAASAEVVDFGCSLEGQPPRPRMSLPQMPVPGCLEAGRSSAADPRAMNVSAGRPIRRHARGLTGGLARRLWQVVWEGRPAELIPARPASDSRRPHIKNTSGTVLRPDVSVATFAGGGFFASWNLRSAPDDFSMAFLAPLLALLRLATVRSG